jgi:hypothetical protein
MMNQEFKWKWLAALRDPKAMQISMELRNDYGGRCCLGVACDLMEVPITNRDLNPTGYDFSDYWVTEDHIGCSYEYEDEIPTDDFGVTIGLRSIELSTLAAMNDKGKTFLEIADYIEEQF